MTNVRLLLAIILLPLTGQALAQGTCELLNVSDFELQNGSLYYLDSENRKPVYKKFSTFEPLPKAGPEALTFVYVVRSFGNTIRESDDWLLDRQGVVVVKSGTRNAESAADSASVKIVRDDDQLQPSNRCSSGFSSEAVNASAYDRYHDLGLQDADAQELGKLRRFHTAYKRRDGSCRVRTDDTARDQEGRSNRSQFSFDANVVKNGIPRQIAIALQPLTNTIIPTAYAATQRYNRRVELRAYQTGSRGVTCVKFKIPVSRLGYFLAVNDLDARTGTPPGYRLQESTWDR